jgi:hypothetical protein
VTLADGQQQQHTGCFEDGFAAVMCAMDLFPGARRISALEVGVRA